MKKTPYFIKLYNLHLSGNIPPKPEEKQRLIHTVYLNYKIPPTVIDKQNTRGESGYTTAFKRDLSPTERKVVFLSSGYLLPTESGYFFSIAPDEFGYCHPEMDWWEKDYPSFLEEYAHLKSFVDGYLEGKLRLKDREWLDRALQSFTTKLVWKVSRSANTACDYGDDFVAPLEQLDAPFPTLNGKKMSEVVKEIDITYVKAKLCPNFHQMTANTIILIPAYLEFIQLLDEKPTLCRCNAYKTPKTPACQNVFVQSGKQGPQQQYCSNTCRVRIGKHEKTYHEDKIKHLRGEW